MLNDIYIKIYGQERKNFFEELREFSPGRIKRSSYSKGYSDKSYERFCALINFLNKKKEQYKDFQYKVLFASRQDVALFNKQLNKELDDAEFYILQLMATTNFKPYDLNEVSSSFFTTDPKSQRGILKKTASMVAVLDYDMDGVLYVHHSFAKDLQESGLKGVELIPINSSDNDYYSFYSGMVGGSDEIKKIFESLDLEYKADMDYPMFYLNREENQGEQRKKMYKLLIDHHNRTGAGHWSTGKAEEYITEFTPPEAGSDLTKWMALDIPQVENVEQTKKPLFSNDYSVYTTENRECPVTGKVFPLLKSKLYLKKKMIPQELDIFRTEYNHLIINKKAFKYLNKNKLLGEGNMYQFCEPVVLV